MIEVFSKRSTEQYLNMFGTVKEYIETDDCLIVVMPNPEDDFKFFSYVNGIHTRKGGTHIDFIMDDIVVPRIKDKLAKKFKTLKYADVKNRLFVIVNMKNIASKFDGQTKESLEVGRAELKEYFKNVDFDKFLQKILKNEDIINPITEIFELKEKQRLLKEMKAQDKKPKKIVDDKFFPPAKEWKSLFLCEGFSARSGLSASLGREFYGYYELKGVPLNVVGNTIQKIMSNAELKGLANVTGIKWTDNNFTDVNFEDIVIATDQDLDGFRIRGLLLGFFGKFAKGLLQAGRIKVLETPLMILKKGNKVEKTYFDFEDFKTSDIKKGYKLKYLKGVGSWTPAEFDQVVEMHGMDKLIRTFEFDEDAEKLINEWLGDEVLTRREYLQQNDFNINEI